MTPTGKIVRLPFIIREELNQTPAPPIRPPQPHPGNHPKFKTIQAISNQFNHYERWLDCRGAVL
jgi:hypothetical protein